MAGLQETNTKMAAGALGVSGGDEPSTSEATGSQASEYTTLVALRAGLEKSEEEDARVL